MDFVKILLATIVCWGVGAVYYMALAKPWLAAVGKTRGQLDGSSKTPFIISFVAELVAVGMMAHIMRNLDATGLGIGIMVGAGLGLGIAGAWIFVNNAYEGKPIKLSIINTGYAVIGLGVAGAILGAWQ